MITQRAYFLCTPPVLQTSIISLTIASYYFSFSFTSVSNLDNRPNFMLENDGKRPCSQVGSRHTLMVPH